MLRRWFLYVGSVLLGLGIVGALLGAFVLALLYPTLPSLESLTDYHPKIPLRIVSADGDLLGEFGEERRAIVNIGEVPDVMTNAILAAEDERFYSHGGVDYLSVLRAAASNVASGTQQGAGTITMQVARNFFLTREKTITRKVREVLLAWKIEANLSKDEILQLYVNQIFLGQRAYGFAAAAQIYFGKALTDVTPAEAAMLAGLPKAPSSFNPVTNPKRAKIRQLYVLRRMHDLKYITDDQFAAAQKAPLAVRQGLRETAPTHAEFVAEMARQIVFDAYGDDAYTKGLTVHTTILKADQEAAYAAVRKGVIDHDRRHGYRGPESYVSLPAEPTEREAVLERLFQEAGDVEGMVSVVVTEASPTVVKGMLADGESVAVDGEGLKFVARNLGEKAAAATRIRPGAVIRIGRDAKGRWEITQMPQAEAAFVSLRPRDGAILSLVGGFDFERNKFNHVTQAQRQPGSAFKPFIYSAALEKGFTPATIVNDAPFFVSGDKTGGDAWEPKNYDGKFDGPMRIRAALARSKNLVTVRVMQAIGPQYAQDYVARFGFDPKLHPPYLPMALGAGAATPLQMVSAYAIFANGGFRVTPYVISRIVDTKGNVLSEAAPVVAGETAERVIDPRNAWMMTSLLKDVVRAGTATRALSLNRGDLAGKTGTTNENVDAWFCGYNTAMVGVSWIGYDQPKGLGSNETGGLAALPMWISYMGKALKGVPETKVPMPDGIIAVTINAESGLRDETGTLTEYFLAEFPPRSRDDSLAPVKTSKDIRDQLF